MSEGATPNLKIILDGLHFLNSYWMFYGINVEILNCHAVSLVLEFKKLKLATIQNCTFGNWTCVRVQKVFINNCNLVFHEGVSKSLKFLNSSVYINNMTMKNEIIIGNYHGIFVQNYSLLHIEQSTFVNNTVKRGIIKTVWSSSLIMLNCTVLGNHATEGPGVILADESFVYLKNTYFNGNTAIKGAGAIYFWNMSFLHIKNCTFKNHSVERLIGYGGAIFSEINSFIDISYSLFDGNKVMIGGAIYQRTPSEMSIMNSIFQNNLASLQGGAVGTDKSLLNISNTTFKNNAHISTSTVNVYKLLYAISNREEGGGAILLSRSVGNISKSRFHNNTASYFCGSMLANSNSSLSISDTTFENNAAGVSGGAICTDNSFMNIEYSI